MLSVLLLARVAAAGRGETRQNVLHIVADDMRTSLGLYNSAEARTPHLDALGARDGSLVFENAYCQFPICSPSRNSFMSGLTPDHARVYNFLTDFREARPNATSLPEMFKRAGYRTLGCGKLFHPDHPPRYDEPRSWSPDANGSQAFFDPAWRSCPTHPQASYCVDDSGGGSGGDSLMEDEDTLAYALEQLRFAARPSDSDSDSGGGGGSGGGSGSGASARQQQRRPFYLGVGFHRPHAPFLVPARFYGWFNGSNASVALAAHATMDASAPNISLFGSFPVRTPGDGELVPWHPRSLPLRSDVALEMRRHYHAGVSFVDDLVGQLLAELERLELSSSTVIVFHSDHGYFLGESGEWEKKMLYENAARVPLIVHDPRSSSSSSSSLSSRRSRSATAAATEEEPGGGGGGGGSAGGGRRTTELAELIDLYPTLAALAGLPPPAGVDGVDLSPLLRRPDAAAVTAAAAAAAPSSPPLKAAAFSQYPRCPADDSASSISTHVCINTAADDITFMGYAARTQDFRYVEWRRWLGNGTADWSAGGLVAAELYNCSGRVASAQGVFDVPERNLAAAGPAAFAAQRAALHQLLLGRFVHGTI